jgi:NTP pyrophosphatase (non-canonical NTP hydrolase)
MWPIVTLICNSLYGKSFKQGFTEGFTEYDYRSAYPTEQLQKRWQNPEYKPRTIEQHVGHVVEECGEVCQCIGKVMRFGLYNYHPTTRESNRDALLLELDDLECAISNLRTALGDDGK